MGLKETAVAGVTWSSASQIGRQGLQILTTVILARILDPSDFGLMGMVLVVIAFVNVFRDMGSTAAIIQRKEIPQSLLSSVFWVNAVFGLLLAAALVLLAPAIASVYNEPRLIPLLRALSVTFILAGVNTSQQALLERHLQFRRSARVELVASLAGGTVSVVMALAGAGVWSLAFQMIVSLGVSSILLWLFIGRWRPSWTFHWTEVRSVAGFSLNLVGFNLSNYVARNADAFLIGKYLGSQALGYYVLAYRVMLMPLASVTGVVSRVMFPMYARMEDDSRVREGVLRVAQMISLITFPLMLGVMVLSREFVLTFLGSQWTQIIPLLIVFSPIGMAQSIDATTGSLYQARGRTDWMFLWGLGTGVVAVVAFAIGLRWGILGVALSYLAASILWTYPGLAIPFRLVDLRVGTLAGKLWRPLGSGAVMALVVGLTVLLLRDLVAPWVLLAIGVAVGVPVYLAVSALANREAMIMATGLLRDLLRRPAVAGAAEGGLT